MFSDLKLIVDVIRSSVSDFQIYKSEKERDQIVLDLLRTYFLFKDCVEEGENLINEAGPDPICTIKRMDKLSANSTLKRWEAILYRQTQRLGSLREFILSQNHLAVITPDIQKRISEIVGNKMERANSLHSIGAALFFRWMFPAAESDEERAGYVTLMAGSESHYLDMEAARQDIESLRDSLNQYRNIIERLVSDDEITRLSNEARRDTLTQDVPNSSL